MKFQEHFPLFTNKYNNSSETIGFLYHSYIEKRKKLVYLNNQTPFGTSYNITIPIKPLFIQQKDDQVETEFNLESARVRLDVIFGQTDHPVPI